MDRLGGRSPLAFNPPVVSKEDISESLPPVVDTDNNRILYAGRDCYLIPEELYEYAGRTKTLDLSFNCIRDLEGLDKFAPTLQELILDNNEITQTTDFCALNQLHLLSLCNNNITDLYAFIDGVEQKLPNLKYLSLLGNEACPDCLSQPDCDEDDYNRYRKYVIYKFPHLKFLDSKPVTSGEKREAKRTGQYLRVVRPATPVEDQQVDTDGSDMYPPLPSALRTEAKRQQPAGTFKKAQQVYQGKHSEGNRFIRDRDL